MAKIQGQSFGLGTKGGAVVIDDENFQKMLKRIARDFTPQPEELEKITNLMAAKALSRTANKLGVAYKKKKFSSSIRSGKNQMKRRYTWKRPTTRGQNAGKPAAQNEGVANSIKIGGRKYTWRKYMWYVRKGSITMVENRLDEIRTKAMKTVGSSKAAFFLIAKALKLPLGDFKERGLLEAAASAAGQRFKSVSKGKKDSSGADYVLEIKTSAHNALNPKVRGMGEFQKSINGFQREFGTLVRKGYIKSLDDIAEHYGAKVTN